MLRKSDAAKLRVTAGLPAGKGLQRKLLGGGGAHYRRGTALAAG